VTASPTPTTAAPPPWPLRAAALAALIAAMALAAAVLAHWAWRWFGPAPEAAPPVPAPARWAEALAASNPFGNAASVPSPATAVAAPSAGATGGGAALAGNSRLLGVMAAADGEGWALFRLGDRGAVLARRGQEFAPDVTLTAVRPDGVTIRDHGQSRDLPLRTAAAPAPPASGAGPAAGQSADRSAGYSAADRTSVAARAACAPPAGFRGPVLRVNAELLTGMGAQPDAWRALLAAAPGTAGSAPGGQGDPGARRGLAVRDESGFGAMLGLKAGDRLTLANGIPLSVPDDVLAAVVKPLTANLPVRVSGTRDGQPAEWLFLNAGACPG
jgi:hypothetical protein